MTESLIDPPEFRLVSLEVFAAEDEPGADALVGDVDAALIPEGGDVMFYGDGGAAKTTLSVDLACHLGAGADWLGIRVARRTRVLIVENEGPRPMLRRKLRRKLAGWTGPPLDGRVSVFEQPWGEFSFADPGWREAFAAKIAQNAIDVLIAGPLTRLGMDEAGTLQQVRDFMALVGDVRRRCGRLLTVVLIHHENKGGAVSGAWEGAADTLLHLTSRSTGATTVLVQKARWDSTRHKTTLELVWTPGEGFAVKEDERDLIAEIEGLLSDGKWRTAPQIAAPKDAGIGANIDTVKGCLAGRPDRFESRTGEAAKALRRSPAAILWGLTQAPESDESDLDALGGEHRSDAPTHPLRGVGAFRLTPDLDAEPTQTPESDAPDNHDLAADVGRRVDAIAALPTVAEQDAAWAALQAEYEASR